jgi:AraC-like DNA-binding protein
MSAPAKRKSNGRRAVSVDEVLSADERVPSRAVRVAREYLHSIPTRDIRLAEVAKVAGVTAFHLAHVFARSLGISVHAYHLLVRIRHARSLLDTGLNAGEAGAAVGFADQSHFTRHFKRVVGMPPGRYARSREREGAIRSP